MNCDRYYAARALSVNLPTRGRLTGFRSPGQHSSPNSASSGRHRQFPSDCLDKRITWVFHSPMLDYLKARRWTIAALVAVLAVTGGIELAMGRLPLGPDGRFGFWEGDIWSSENSQRFADPYSFSHIVHGLLFYALLWRVAGFLPAQRRFLIALLLEAGWEILENSPIIINRYRSVTISLGYNGDSVLNSLSDILMMSLGYLLAYRLRPWQSVTVVLAMELGCLLCVRDNLTLNVIMLIHPIEAIRHWQMAGHPGA